MANSQTVQILEDGPGYAVVKLSFVLDTSDMVETVLADPATLMIDQGYSVVPNRVTIERVQWSVPNPLVLRLQWKAAANTEAAAYYDAGDHEYRYMGGIKNNAAAGVTGQLVAITSGWTAGTLAGFAVVWVSKGN